MKFLVKNNSDGCIHEVRKYIKSDDGEESVWCSSWYGRHVIGKDCEIHDVILYTK